jgi:hypothetical protein
VCDVYTHEVTTGEGAGSLAALRLTFLRKGFRAQTGAITAAEIL